MGVWLKTPVKWNYCCTRSLGHSTPLLLAPAEGWGALRALRALWALLGALGPLFSSRICKRRYIQYSVKIGPHMSQ